MSAEKIVKTVCNMCPISCGIDVHVRNGKITQIVGMKEHPFRMLCVKSQGIIDWIYSKERITRPLRKTNGKWKKISWDEAFGVIAGKLSRIKEEYGAKALVVHLGYLFTATHVERMASRFCSVYGTPNYTTGASLCFAARVIGHSLTFNHNTIAMSPSFRDTRCILVWGSNPPESNLLATAAIFSLKKRAKLIVIDPRSTSLAKKADIYAQIRPGTDCALALGLLNVIISEELYDKPFVDEWTVGFDKLVGHVRNYTPEKVSEITWIPAETIRNIARMYATNKPATILQGVSLDHCTNGIQTSRAIATLVAVTGNFDIAGGNTYCSPLRQKSLRIKGKVSISEAIGAEYPLFSRFIHETTSMPVADAIISGKPYPVKALIVQGSNPILTWPNTNKLKKAFEELELLVAIDVFMTETAELADIVLPAAAFLEKKVLKDYFYTGLPLILREDKAIDPPGNCLPDWKIWSELGRKMGYEEYFPWKDENELFEYLLEPTNITLDQLRKSPHGVSYQPREQKRYLIEGFNTPSGKVEIYSKIMEEHGYDPMPTFREPAESAVSKSDLVEKYPLVLISGTRTKVFTHSQHRNVPLLRKQQPEPLIEINAKTAKDLGIGDGDLVTVESPRGSIELKVKVTQDIHPGVVSIQHGWSEANVNVLTDDEARDPISGYPGLKSVLCRAVKKG